MHLTRCDRVRETKTESVNDCLRKEIDYGESN